MTSSSSILHFHLDPILSSNGIPFSNHYSSTSSIESERRIKARNSSSATITVQRQDTPTAKSVARLADKLKLDSKVNLDHSILTDSPSTTLLMPPWKDSSSNQLESLELKEIDYQDWDRIADAFKSLADACRSESPRTILGESKLPELLSLLLSFTIQSGTDATSSKELQDSILNHLQTELLRSIANLCIDHDVNRSLMLSVGIPDKILQILDRLIGAIESQEGSSDEIQMQTLVKLRTTLGCLLNLQLENNEIKKSLLINSLNSFSSTTTLSNGKPIENSTMDFLKTLLRIATNPKIYLPASWCASLNPSPSHSSLENLLISSTISKWSFRILTELLTPLERSKDSQSETGTDSDGASSSEDNLEIDEVNDLIKRVRSNSSRDPSLLYWILRPFHHFSGKRLHYQTDSNSSHSFEISSEEVDEMIDTDAEILSNLSELWHGLAEDCCLEFKWRMINGEGIQDQTRPPLETLMDFIEFSSHPKEWEPDGIEDPDGNASGIIIERPEDFEAALESIKAFGMNKALIGKSLILIVSEDRLMDALFSLDQSNIASSQTSRSKSNNWFIQKCLSWLKSDPRSRPDLISLGILYIGNLARKDINCIKLLELTNIEGVLYDLLKSTLLPSKVDSKQEGDVTNSSSKEFSKPHLPSSEDLKIIHSILGLLKNLSIPKINKSKLTNSNFIELVSNCLDSKFDRIQPVQFLAVGVLKNLASTPSGEGGMRLSVNSNTKESLDPSNQKNTIEKILALIKRSEDLPIKLESSRILVNSIKYLWSPISSEDQKVGEQSLSTSRSLFIRRGITNVLSEMVRDCEKYPILINEGIFALTLLASSERGARLVAISLIDSRRSKIDEDSNKQEDSISSSNQHSKNDSSSALSMINSILSLKMASLPIEFVINCCSLINSLANTGVEPHILSEEESLTINDSDLVKDADQDREEWQADFNKSEEALNQIERVVRRSLQNLIDDSVSPKEILKPAHTALQSCNKRFTR